MADVAMLTAAIVFKVCLADSCLDLVEQSDLRDGVGEGVLFQFESSHIELGMTNESVETLGSSNGFTSLEGPASPSEIAPS